MLIVFCGSPLMVELRTVPVCVTPGSRLTAFKPLRDTSGNDMICSVVSVEVTVALWVCTSLAPPRTSTVSVRAPICSTVFTSAVVPPMSRTSLTTDVLKPDRATVTEYVPGLRPGTTNTPDALVTTDSTTPVAVFLTSTVAPGMTPPSLSTTDPVNVAVLPPVWAHTAALVHSSIRQAALIVRSMKPLTISIAP